MGPKYKDKYRNERRSRSRERIKVERFRSPSNEFRRMRSESPSVEALKNLARMPASEMNHHQRPEIEFDQDFFFRMSKRLRDDFTDSVDRDAFTRSLYSEMNGKEFELSFYKPVSICLQWLIENATDAEDVKKLTERFSIKKYNLEFVNNQFSSHVIQQLLEGNLKVLSRECTLDSYGQRHFKWSLNYILDVAEYVVTNINAIFFDQNGYHVVTTGFLEALGGIRIGRIRNKKALGFGQKTNIFTDIEKDIVIKELPSLLKSGLKRLAESIFNRDSNGLKELINNKSTSFIQYLLYILRIRINDYCQEIIKKLIDLIFKDYDNKVAAVQNPNVAYLVECILLVSSEHRLKRIWEKHFKGNLRSMYCDDIVNFIVQRLIDRINSDQLYQDVSSEILPHLGSIFLLNRPGIGVCLAKATLKFPEFQQEFIYAIMKAFHCYEPKEKQVQLIPLMLFSENTTTTQNHKQQHNNNRPPNSQCWLHASLMLQYMFQFKEPKRVYKSLLSMSAKEIVTISNDASGSHTVDAFLKSLTVPEKAIEEFINKLSGYFVSLACNKYGSRVIDNIFSSVNIKLKHKILDEFSAQESTLQNNKNGYFLSKSIGLYHYKYRYDEWKEFENQKQKKRKTFSELIDDRKLFDDRIDDSMFKNHHNYNQNSNYYNNDQQSNSSHHSFNNRKQDHSYDNNNNNNSMNHYFKRPRSSYRQSPYYK